MPVGSTTPLTVAMYGVAGIPTNATAVVLNVTAVGATHPTFVSVYPDGTTPASSNLNVDNASPVANMVVVPLGAGGRIKFGNHGGTVNLIADIAGYYAP